MAEERKANGRRAVLQALDVLLAKEDNIKKFATAFQEQIDEDPYLFFRGVVMPLLPKDLNEEAPTEQVLTVKLVPHDGGKNGTSEEGIGNNA